MELHRLTEDQTVYTENQMLPCYAWKKRNEKSNAGEECFIVSYAAATFGRTGKDSTSPVLTAVQPGFCKPFCMNIASVCMRSCLFEPNTFRARYSSM